MTREPTEMEKRCAEQLAEKLIAESGSWNLAQVDGGNPLILTLDGQFDVLDLVRVVIRAMREPTPEMHRAGMKYEAEGVGYSLAGDVFKAMIDAASPPEGK